MVLGVYPTSMCSVCTVGLGRIEQRSIVTALWFHQIWYYQESSGSPQKGSQLCVTVCAQETLREGILTCSDNIIPLYQPQLGSSHQEWIMEH